jgi:hypothetical protein
VALVVTRHAREKGLPLMPDELLTERGGQLLGLGKSAVQSILAVHDLIEEYNRIVGEVETDQSLRIEIR